MQADSHAEFPGDVKRILDSLLAFEYTWWHDEPVIMSPEEAAELYGEENDQGVYVLGLSFFCYKLLALQCWCVRCST